MSGGFLGLRVVLSCIETQDISLGTLSSATEYLIIVLGKEIKGDVSCIDTSPVIIVWWWKGSVLNFYQRQPRRWGLAEKHSGIECAKSVKKVPAPQRAGNEFMVSDRAPMVIDAVIKVYEIRSSQFSRNEFHGIRFILQKVILRLNVYLTAEQAVCRLAYERNHKGILLSSCKSTNNFVACQVFRSENLAICCKTYFKRWNVCCEKTLSFFATHAH